MKTVALAEQFARRWWLAAIMSLIAAAVCRPAAADVPPGGNWSGWRGNGSGISGESGLPLTWTATNGVRWRTPLPGEGSSSPIVWGPQVFVTASTEAGQKRQLLCLDARDGRIRWQREVPAARVPKTDPKSGYAPATPVTDGRRVYAFFDSPGLVAFDLDGRPRWTVPLGPFESPYNVASSPIVFQDLVILCCDHGGEAFILAVDAATGTLRWRTPRKQGIQFSTPLAFEHRGAWQIAVSAAEVKSYDPLTGRELWSCGGLNGVVTPSPVYANGLVYATSGRNGPALAIDPGGRADVKETHVRMHVPTGGPYVPSPLVLGPLLMLPGDDGAVRLVNARGQVVLTERLRAHFTASPIVAGGRIYWTSERGDTFVLDPSRIGEAKPVLRIVSINPLGETCLASPAVSGDAVFIRTAQALYCLAGTGPLLQTDASQSAPAMDVAALQRRFEEHPAAEGADIPVRLAVVDALAHSQDGAAVVFLAQVALKDPHWDVSEAAAKAVTAADGPESVTGLLGMLADSRPYLQVLGAEGLGRQRVAGAAPALLKAAQGRDPLVRIACLQALAGVGDGPVAAAETNRAALVTALADRDGRVREAAVRGLMTLAGRAGGARETLIQGLLSATADPNPLVVAAVLEALTAYGYPAERSAKLMDDLVLYGGPRADSVETNLTAGPIRLKFRDGELRYLFVGDREIVRRIYFAVRDKRFDTVMPAFSQIEVHADGDGFVIRLAAVCRSATADYRWTGEISGTPEGRITFRVEGQANRPFPSPRIGLNVLLGSDALAGQAFETTDLEGQNATGLFPKEVVPGLLTAVNLTSLRYGSAGKLQVEFGVAGGAFGVEDQRNFCDTSYKAFHSLGYPAHVPTNDVRSVTLTLDARHARAEISATGVVRISVGRARRDRKLPVFGPAATDSKPQSFVAMNGTRAKLAAATNLCWAFNPAAHMPDEDTFMENVPAVVDQVRTVRTLAPRAGPIRIDPVDFDSPYPRPARDPRNYGLFGAAWLSAMADSLAAAGVAEAGFAVGPGPATGLLQDLAACAGRPMLGVDVTGPLPLPACAFGVQDGKTRVLWLANRTNQPQSVEVTGLPKRDRIELRRLNRGTLRGDVTAVQAAESRDGSVELTLQPYEVCRLLAAGRP